MSAKPKLLAGGNPQIAKAEHDRLAAKGVKFTTPVTSATGSIIAVLDDTCGNLIQLVQLNWG